MDEIEWWEFDSTGELAEQAAGDIGFVIDSAIEAHGGARIALATGEGAEPVLNALAKSRKDWAKVTIIPTDDRLVGLDDASSGFAKLQRIFGAKGAEVVSLVDEAALGDYREAGRLADARLAMQRWPLDMVLLEADGEGRAAAFFAGPDLDPALTGPRERRAVGLRPQAGGGDRVTLTAAALSSARAMMILARGSAAREALEQGIKEGPLSSRPVGRLLSEIDAAVDIFWSAS
jgi:6-phosphogluconolactonase